MRSNIISFLLFLCPIFMFSQQKRQFIQNEATQSQMKTLHKNYAIFSKYQQSYRENSMQTASELYIEIPQKGYFTIEFAGQINSNATGKFLFFDVVSGRQPLSIYREGYLVYRSFIHIPHTSRLSFSFSTEFGLYLEETTFLNEHYSQFPNNTNLKPIFTDAEFKIFKEKLDKQAIFDDEKIIFINQQLVTTSFTSQQIKQLVESTSLKKLEIAKKLYHHCVDPQNYFFVLDALSFNSEKKKLAEYISQQ